MKKSLFDYERGENLEVESPDTQETLEMKIKKDLKARRKILLRVLVVVLLIFLVDAGIHLDCYDWYDWANGLSVNEEVVASTLVARYQVADTLVNKTAGKAQRAYTIERKYAARELRALGYRGSIPSKEWPDLT